MRHDPTPLPIGIQTFREIREGRFYYVDKTGFALRLLEEGKYYFLSRPRRCGKSLFLDNITDAATARAMRDGLRNLYSVIKGQDAHIRFAFLTGVSKFSKVSLFSGLNNLRDITVDARYSAICGYTEADLDRVFAPELERLDRAQIRAWYNG